MYETITEESEWKSTVPYYFSTPVTPALAELGWSEKGEWVEGKFSNMEGKEKDKSLWMSGQKGSLFWAAMHTGMNNLETAKASKCHILFSKHLYKI